MSLAKLRFPVSKAVAALSVSAASLACSINTFGNSTGWSLNWVDEFNGTAIDSSRWERLSRRDSFNNEKQYYLPDQVSVANGTLRLTATNQPLDGKPYRSGLVRTWQEQTFGRWEVRADLPSTQGMWPAIWLLPRNANWPSGGEIDIMENRGSQPNVVGSAYHFGASVAAHQYIAQDFGYSVNGTPVSFQNGMHTYAVDWDPSRIRFYVNGIPHFTLYQNAAPISSTPMSLILNLAVGGNYGGDPDASTVFPQRFDIDSVRTFSRDFNSRGLANGGFESTAGDYFTEWDEYSNFDNVRVDGLSTNARSGSRAAQMFGRFNGQTNNSGLFQETPTTPGEVWQVGAWSRNRPGDRLAGANTASIKLEFINGNGGVIEVAVLNVADASSPTAYREAVLRRTAPAGAVFVRAVLEMVQRNNAGGAVNFDDASLRRVIPSSLLGDINLDGAANSADLDALLHSLNASNSLFNFNADGAVNGADFDRLLGEAFNTVRGDLNLDQAVNFDDLLILAQNYDRLGTGTWSLGDVTGEGNVNFDDLLLLAQNYEFGVNLSDGTSNGFAGDWALARALVPEPALLSGIALAGLMKRKRTHVTLT